MGGGRLLRLPRASCSSAWCSGTSSRPWCCRAPRPRGDARRRSSSASPGRSGDWRALRQMTSIDQEKILGSYAPATVLLVLMIWMGLIVLGFGLLLYALREGLEPAPDFGSALYFAGTSVLTIASATSPPRRVRRGSSRSSREAWDWSAGAGDHVPVQPLRLVQRREILVVRLEARAGAPPSGVALLEAYGPRRPASRTGALPPGLGSVGRRRARYPRRIPDPPLLPLVARQRVVGLGAWRGARRGGVGPHRSRRRTAGRGTLGAADRGPLRRGPAQSLRLGPHAERAGRPGRVRRGTPATGGRRLGAFDADASWERFVALRSDYATRLNAMALYWVTPPAMWIGDRGQCATSSQARGTAPPEAARGRRCGGARGASDR